jgi:hypothetical protein
MDSYVVIIMLVQTSTVDGQLLECGLLSYGNYTKAHFHDYLPDMLKVYKAMGCTAYSVAVDKSSTQEMHINDIRQSVKNGTMYKFLEVPGTMLRFSLERDLGLVKEKHVIDIIKSPPLDIDIVPKYSDLRKVLTDKLTGGAPWNL